MASKAVKAFLLSSYKLVICILLCSEADICIAQSLEYLPPVINTKTNTDTATSFLLGTLNVTRLEGKTETTPHASSIQIIDADQSWPPRWYTITPFYTDQMYAEDMSHKQLRVNFTIKPEIDRGYISFCEIQGIANRDDDVEAQIDTMEYYVILNKSMSRVDTIKSRVFYNGSWSPDYKGKSVERIWVPKRNIKLDLKKFLQNNSDSILGTALVKEEKIEVLGKNNTLIFSWSPLDHLDPDLFKFRAKLSNSGEDAINLCQFTSVNWDYDGNILYALKDIGIGKIAKGDGSIMWHLDYTNMPLVNGFDTLKSFAPSDFKFLEENDTSAIYSFYEKGNDTFRVMRGCIFELDKKSNRLKSVKYKLTSKRYESSGQGGCDYDIKTGNYIISYGIYENTDPQDGYFQKGFEYGKKDSVLGIYQLPRLNYSVGVHKVENWPLPPRPSIVAKGNLLEVKGKMTEWTWYELSGTESTNARKIGTGKTITPQNNGVYCVVGKYGAGYCVSYIYRYNHNAPY